MRPLSVYISACSEFSFPGAASTNRARFEQSRAFFHRIYQILTNIREISLVNWWNL